MCPKCDIKVQKASKKALSHPKDHLEFSLRPIQATQVTPRPFWTRHKRLKPFGLQIKMLRLKTYFPLKEPYSSLSIWNGVCVSFVLLRTSSVRYMLNERQVTCDRRIFWYFCYYLHTSRYSVSPVCLIFTHCSSSWLLVYLVEHYFRVTLIMCRTPFGKNLFLLVSAISFFGLWYDDNWCPYFYIYCLRLRPCV